MGAGRPKGSKNKLKEGKVRLEELGKDPIDKLVKIAEDKETPLGQKIDIWKTLMQYGYGKMTEQLNENETTEKNIKFNPIVISYVGTNEQTDPSINK